MDPSGEREAHADAGSLHLWVRRLGVRSTESGPPRVEFRWQVEPTELEVLGSYAGGPLFAPPGIDVSCTDVLRLVALNLVDSGERFGTGEPSLGSHPEWLRELAHRNLHELRMLAEATTTPPAKEPAVDERQHGSPLDLMAVEMAREVLHHEAELIDAGALDAEELGAIREFVERADPEVVIVRPGDPWATPLYEGRAADAHLHLTPGRYPAAGTSDARRLVVIVGGSPFAASGLASAAFTVSDATTDPGREPDHGRSSAPTIATARPAADRTPPTHRRPQPMRQAPPTVGADRPAALGLEL